MTHKQYVKLLRRTHYHTQRRRLALAAKIRLEHGCSEVTTGNYGCFGDDGFTWGNMLDVEYYILETLQNLGEPI